MAGEGGGEAEEERRSARAGKPEAGGLCSVGTAFILTPAAPPPQVCGLWHPETAVLPGNVLEAVQYCGAIKAERYGAECDLCRLSHGAVVKCNFGHCQVCVCVWGGEGRWFRGGPGPDGRQRMGTARCVCGGGGRRMGLPNIPLPHLLESRLAGGAPRECTQCSQGHSV